MHTLSDRITRISGASSRGQLSFDITIAQSPRRNSFDVNNQQDTHFYLLEILAILKREGYLRFYTIRTVGRSVQVTVFLKYNAQGIPAIRSIFSVSTPGRPVHISTLSLWQPLSTTGRFILSTSRGLLTDKEARRLSVGGTVVLGIFLYPRYLVYLIHE